MIRYRLLMIALALVLALTACASGGVPATGGMAAPTAGTSDNAAEGRVLTQADNGTTIQMKVGESVLLKLGSDTYRWATEVDDTAVLSRDIAAMIERDAQGLFVANAPGTAILTAAGTPLCRDATPQCGAPDELFRVTVVVEK